MFWDAPPDYRPTAAERDLAERWMASPEQIEQALTLLADQPRRVAYAYAPIALPGKAHGIWTVGQPVEYPDGVFLTRDEASRAAVTHLGTREGQPSYAVIWRDGHAAVFEDYRGLFDDDPIREP